MKHTLLLPVLFALLLLPCPAEAIYMTAKELDQSCMADDDRNTWYCLGYIAGVIDYHVMMQSLGTAPTIDFCLPASVSVQQAAVTVLSYLKRTPQNGDFIAASTIPLALHDSFPCAPAGRKRK
jgi:hypothetical protein